VLILRENFNDYKEGDVLEAFGARIERDERSNELAPPRARPSAAQSDDRE